MCIARPGSSQTMCSRKPAVAGRLLSPCCGSRLVSSPSGAYSPGLACTWWSASAMVTHIHNKNRDLIPLQRVGLGPTPAQAATSNSLFLHVKAAAATAARTSAGAGGGLREKPVAAGFTSRPKMGGQLMLNPNTASGQAVIVRRGKERASGKKKRVSTLKKIILRERSAKDAARAAVGLAYLKDGGDAAAVDGGDGVQQRVEEEEQGDDIVLHVARDHVYISLETCSDGQVRVHMLPVEAHDEDETGSGDEEGSSSSTSWSDADGDDDAASVLSGDAHRIESEHSAAAVVDHDAADSAGLAAVGGLRVDAAPFVPFGGRTYGAPGPAATACALCGVQCGTALVLDQHMRGKSHSRHVRAAAAQALREQSAFNQANGGGVPADSRTEPQTQTQQAQRSTQCRYGRQVVTPELNGATAALLTRLLELQARLRAREPLKAKARQRLVFGLRECSKALRTRRAKALVVAPNVEQITAPGGLDEAVDDLLAAARQTSVPVVLALTRSRMGALTGRRVKMSAACVLDASGCEEAFKAVLKMAEDGEKAWMRQHPDAEPLPSAGSSLAALDAPLLLLRRDGRQRTLRPGEQAPAAAARVALMS